jgi:hypothetical protein
MDFQAVELAIRGMFDEVANSDETFPSWLLCETHARSPCDNPTICPMTKACFTENWLAELKRRTEPVRLPDTREIDYEHDVRYGVNQQLG